MIQSLRKKLDFKGIKCPIKVEHYHKIEKQNSISINVFGYEDETNILSINHLQNMLANQNIFSSKLLIDLCSIKYL